MKRLLIIAALVAATATLAACGGNDDNDNAAPSSGGSATVSAKQVGDAGTVLVNSSGQALYAADQEAGGKVLCTGACNSFWKPVTISAGAPSASDLPGKLGVTTRPDGSRQVTYNGKLLYSFTQDRPGQVTGDGFSDDFAGRQFNWHVIRAEGGGDSSGGGSSSGGGYGGGGY
jgi:predicted lipoprotein with Yx(FWY)xxD motif